MWKKLCIFFVSILSCRCIVAEDCYTPLGEKSQCIELYKCEPIAPLFTTKPIKPLSDYTVKFLRQSYCGFQDYIPNVCCGPIPPEDSETTPPALSEVKDEFAAEDSVPASRDQCGVDRDGDKIYGGEVGRIEDFPWMVLLGYKNSKGVMQYKCGGSLINRRYVLTAAHCLKGYNKKKYGPLTSARLGENDVRVKPNTDCKYNSCESRLQEIAVDFAYAHPNYTVGQRSRHNDIGIVRLAKRANYTYYVQPICLAKNDDQPLAGSLGFIAGWGRTLQAKSSDVMRKLNLTIFDKNECIRKFQNYGVYLNDKQLCAGGVFNEDSCFGDSGGPLMMKSPELKWEAVGVISFGVDCGNMGWPGVYTSVGGFLDWIRLTINATNHQ